MTMHHLPHEIISDILSRLPYEYAIPCKEVCKTWRNLLRHIKRNPKVTHLLFARKNGKDGGMQLYYGEYDEKSKKNLNEQLSFDALTPLGYPHIVYSSEHRTYRPMVGSHRGLVCFYETHNNVDDPINICNPFTKETVLLPRLPGVAKDDFLVSGFGYVYPTNEYKVVRIHYSPSRFRRGQVQVYTLGDKINGWRNKEDDLFLTNRCLSRSNGILYDGTLHWIDDMRSSEIVAFDLADEKFRSIQLPNFLSLTTDYDDDYAELLLLGGNLSVLVRRNSLQEINIWSLKETKSKSGCKNWKNQCTIRTKKEDLYHPFALTEENKVLILNETQVNSSAQGRKNTLRHYNPKTATLEEFRDVPDITFQEFVHNYLGNPGSFEELEDDYANSFPNFQFQVIPYMKSHVSLTLADLPVLHFGIS